MNKIKTILFIVTVLSASACSTTTRQAPPLARQQMATESELQGARFYEQSPTFLVKAELNGEAFYWGSPAQGDSFLKVNGTYHNTKDLRTLSVLGDGRVTVEHTDGRRWTVPSDSVRELFTQLSSGERQQFQHAPLARRAHPASFFQALPTKYIYGNSVEYTAAGAFDRATPLNRALKDLNNPSFKITFLTPSEVTATEARRKEILAKERTLADEDSRKHQEAMAQEKQAKLNEKLRRLASPAKGTEAFCTGSSNYNNVFDCHDLGQFTDSQLLENGWVIANRMPRTVQRYVSEYVTVHDILIRKVR